MLPLPVDPYAPRPQPAAAARGQDARVAGRSDFDALAADYRAHGRTRAADFLRPELARALHQRLQDWDEWGLVTRIGGSHRVFDAAAMQSLPPDRQAGFDQLVAEEARAGFQYLYDRYPLYERGRAGQLADPVLAEAYAMLRSPAFLDAMRTITGHPGIEFADGQLTRYRRGHFLTLHDDHAEGLGRIAAYVLNLTPAWAADFGGQLQFADDQGQAQSLVMPRFNLLTLFSVPQPHLVSLVAPFAPGARYAITGWLRLGPEPAPASA